MDIDDLPDEYWVVQTAGVSSYVGHDTAKSIAQEVHMSMTGFDRIDFEDIFGMPTITFAHKVDLIFRSTPEQRAAVALFDQRVRALAKPLD